MKKTAKILSLILSLALLAGAFGVTAYADGTPTVTVGTAQASAGDTVAVTVSLSDCTQFSSYTIYISYDSDYVTAIEAKKGIDVMLYMPNLTVNGKKEIAIVGGDVNNKTDNGVIATVYFKIAENYPGGVTEVPLKINELKLTEYNGKTDVAFASQGVDGKIVISGAGGNVIWNGGEGESELTPGTLTDEQAAEYKNPITNEGVSGGEYYVNEEEKIAIPAADVEAGVKNDPDSFKVVETETPEVPEVITPAESSSGGDGAGEGGKLNWLLIGCIAGGVVIVAAGAIAVAGIIKKKKNAQAE